MKNFKITAVEDGKEYWISRSVAVAVVVFSYSMEDGYVVLANRRGEGAADFQGLWNVPCGYLDFDETLKEAAVREVFEETGYRLDINHLQMRKISDSPSENHQNITVAFGTWHNCYEEREALCGGEENEVEEIKWIPMCDLDKYQWAFKHDVLIKQLFPICG